jgi:hypothetical protein
VLFGRWDDRKVRACLALFLVLIGLTSAAKNQWQREIDGVSFDSEYDNGSLGDVAHAGENRFTASLHTEDGELGQQRYWFRFRMAGEEGRVVVLALDHGENPRPFVRENERAWRRMTAEEAPDDGTLVVTLAGGESPVEVAFFEPLGVGETDLAVQSLIARHPSLTSSALLGQTAEGREVTMITIDDPLVDPSAKRRLWVHSRAHAGEVTGTHSLLGFLEQMMEDSPAGLLLRERLRVHMVPLLNIDGVHDGYTRWDAEGRDPESQWCAIDSPAVQSVKTQVDQLMQEPEPISLALNLHSTRGVYADTFFFKHLFPSVSRNFETIQQRYINAFDRATPLFENRSPESSQLHECRFIESYFWNNWGEDVMALTHEGHYHRRVTDDAWLTGADYREMGKGMALALIEYYDLGEVPATRSFAIWKADHFNFIEVRFDALSGPGADPDRDGIPNLLEYGFSTDPKEPDRMPRTLTLEDDHGLAFTRSVMTEDLTWSIEQSDDLQTWETLPSVDWRVTSEIDVEFERVRVPLALPRKGAFLRVVAVLDKVE